MDDWIIWGQTAEQVALFTEVASLFLIQLGFKLNLKKSVTVSCSQISYLGIEYN